MTRKLLIATVAALAGFSGGLAGWLTAYASAPVADCQPYIDRGYSLVCSLNLSHGTIAAAPMATDMTPSTVAVCFTVHHDGSSRTCISCSDGTASWSDLGTRASSDSTR